MAFVAWFLERFIGSLLLIVFGAWGLVSANAQLLSAIARMVFEVWTEDSGKD